MVPLMPFWFFLIALAAFGAVFGSFGNVVIWRLPRGESLSNPPSRCPSCGHAIRWFDNIPIASWLVLRGRCRDCGEPISIRYPVIEALSAGAWVLAGVLYGQDLRTVFAIAFFYLLLVLSAIDLDVRRLPDPLVALMATIGVAGAIVSQVTGVRAAPLIGVGGWPSSSPLIVAIVGAALGAGLAAAIAAAYGLVRGRQGMGMGDIKLLAAIGLFLGPYVVLANVIGAAVVLVPLAFAGGTVEPAVSAHGLDDADIEDDAAPAAPTLSEADGTADPEPDDAPSLAGSAIPFGPSLAAAAVITAAWGPAAVAWYLRLAGIA